MENNVDDVGANRNGAIVITHIPMTYKKIRLATYKEFAHYLKLKYLNNESAIDLNEEREFDHVFNLGLIQAKDNLQYYDSPLLHKGKRPRRDEWERLGAIVSEFLKIQSYPIIPSGSLSFILNKALGNRDPRTIREYRKTILLYCNVNEIQIARNRDSSLGQLDVSFFVHLIPKQYINVCYTASSTSIFQDVYDTCSNTAILGTKNDEKLQ